MSCLSPVAAGCQLGSARALCPTPVAPGEASSSSCGGNLHGAKRKPPACCARSGCLPVPWLVVSILLCPASHLQQCLGHPLCVAVLPVKGQGERSVPICPSRPQGWSSATMLGVHVQFLGSPGFQRLLFQGVGLPYHDTLSPYWCEPAVPAPPAMHTVISTGRAEASLIIGSDSSARSLTCLGHGRTFRQGWSVGPAGILVCRPPCGAWLAPQHQSGDRVGCRVWG